MTDQTEREALTIHKDTGEWLSGGTIVGRQGAVIAASVLPGVTPEQVEAFYASVMNDSPAPHVVTTAEPGLYSDVTLADWNTWARDHDQWELPPGSDQVDERTVEFAVALANTFGPTDDARADSHVEVVSWFMEDAIECIEHVPAGPIKVTKIDATHGNYTFVIVVNGFAFVVPDGEGDIYIEPLCPLPAPGPDDATVERVARALIDLAEAGDIATADTSMPEDDWDEVYDATLATNYVCNGEVKRIDGDPKVIARAALDAIEEVAG